MLRFKLKSSLETEVVNGFKPDILFKHPFKMQTLASLLPKKAKICKFNGYIFYLNKIPLKNCIGETDCRG